MRNSFFLFLMLPLFCTVQAMNNQQELSHDEALACIHQMIDEGQQADQELRFNGLFAPAATVAARNKSLSACLAGNPSQEDVACLFDFVERGIGRAQALQSQGVLFSRAVAAALYHLKAVVQFLPDTQVDTLTLEQALKKLMLEISLNSLAQEVSAQEQELELWGIRACMMPSGVPVLPCMTPLAGSGGYVPYVTTPVANEQQNFASGLAQHMYRQGLKQDEGVGVIGSLCTQEKSRPAPIQTNFVSPSMLQCFSSLSGYSSNVGSVCASPSAKVIAPALGASVCIQLFRAYK